MLPVPWQPDSKQRLAPTQPGLGPSCTGTCLSVKCYVGSCLTQTELALVRPGATQLTRMFLGA